MTVLFQEGFIEWIDLYDLAVMRIRQVRDGRGVFEVLLAGQDRVPQCYAAGAVGKRAGSRRGTFQGRDAFGRTSDIEFTEAVDAAGMS